MDKFNHCGIGKKRNVSGRIDGGNLFFGAQINVDQKHADGADIRCRFIQLGFKGGECVGNHVPVEGGDIVNEAITVERKQGIIKNGWSRGTVFSGLFHQHFLGKIFVVQIVLFLRAEKSTV